ncbi:hypothetical protein AU15_21385 [Marinobacter salarius]|jgi:hypothetical protein|uniref:Uncharacterized protein n=1 Tax=Marinobacter salarius TaxID=1420917 RepID=W5YWG1_9GAMM|nr:hypothetical protein AU15_21385 [Marinobacter salarius]
MNSYYCRTKFSGVAERLGMSGYDTSADAIVNNVLVRNGNVYRKTDAIKLIAGH